MKILLTNNHLNRPGGSETACYTLAVELLRQGHTVDIYAPIKGIVWSKMQEQGCGWIRPGHYDLAIVSHTPTQKHLMENPHITIGRMIRVCHGTGNELEQPFPGADAYVSISEEVQAHLKAKGYQSTVILNGIDTHRFRRKAEPNRELHKVLALTQSEKAQNILEDACRRSGVQLLTLDKFRSPRWDVENAINEADLVISLGRGALEAMACERPVIVWDFRDYQGNMGDGYCYPDLLHDFAKCNFSGRKVRAPMDADDFTRLFRDYWAPDGRELRKWVVENANIKIQAKKYLSL